MPLPWDPVDSQHLHIPMTLMDHGPFKKENEKLISKVGSAAVLGIEKVAR